MKRVDTVVVLVIFSLNCAAELLQYKDDERENTYYIHYPFILLQQWVIK